MSVTKTEKQIYFWGNENVYLFLAPHGADK